MMIEGKHTRREDIVHSRRFLSQVVVHHVAGEEGRDEMLEFVYKDFHFVIHVLVELIALLEAQRL